MAKLIMFICVALLIGGVISASTGRSSTGRAVARPACGRHGDPCSNGCCTGFNCHPYAGKCQATITATDLINARNNLRHVPRSERRY